LSQGNNNDNQKLFVFPGGDRQHKPVWATRRLYRCPKCGNTRIFYGRAKVDATILVTAIGAFEYDIAEYSIDETGKTEHVITHCAECGALKIEEYEVKLQPNPILTESTTGRIRTVANPIDPLPPHERDVEFPSDGCFEAISQEAGSEIALAEMGIESPRREIVRSEPAFPKPGKDIPYIPLTSDMFDDEPDF